MVVDWGDDERRLTSSVSVLSGPSNGAYPSGNSLLVRGSGESVLIDPSVTVVERGGAPAPVDAVINSHSHEDHMAGNGMFADARLHIHAADLPGASSIDGLLDVYGLEGQTRTDFTSTLYEEFNYAPRPDAEGFHDGHVFDLGGVTVEAVHLPGHTRGHSGFRISNGVFFLSDIDLTGFGPYYGDAWSDLDDFEESLRRVRDEEADFYVTFHHKGVIEGRETFVGMVDAFAAVIGRRHDGDARLPRRAAHDRRHDAPPLHLPPPRRPRLRRAAERRTAFLHVQRMLARGEADRGRARHVSAGLRHGELGTGPADGPQHGRAQRGAGDRTGERQRQVTHRVAVRAFELVGIVRMNATYSINSQMMCVTAPKPTVNPKTVQRAITAIHRCTAAPARTPRPMAPR